MKTINRIFCLAGSIAALLSTASCDLSQKAQSAFSPEDLYTNATLVEMNIFGIYDCLGEQNSHRGRYLPWYGFNTDIECYQSGKLGDGKLDIAAYNCLPNNSQLNLDNGPFTKLVEGIERANIVVDGIRTYGGPDIKPLLGEALTARAFLYLELLKAYGEVPARFAPVNKETIYINKTDKDEIYIQILDDLREAIVCLDGVKPKNTDRVGKVFAEGLFARAALMASGSSWRPDEKEVGTGNIGSKRTSTASELQKAVLYPEILSYLEDAIENGGLSLYSDYEQLWRDFNNFDLTAGKEVIFSIPFSNSRGRWNYTFAVRSYIKGTDRGGSAGPTPYLYYKYKEGDQRREVSCVNWKWDDSTPSKQVPAGEMNWYFGKFRFEWMEKVPYTGGNDDGIKPVYMRYSDILLMAAEVANELGKSTQAEKYFKQVRTRAFCGDEALAMAGINTSDKDAFFKHIQDERALEFVGEMLRKQDLIRWGILKQQLDYAKEEIAKCARLEGEYSGHGPAVWYSYGRTGEIITYGIAPGELADETKFVGEDEWILESKEYFKENDSCANRIASIYTAGIDPEQKMWWPIPEKVITNYQGSLKNDYGY